MKLLPCLKVTVVGKEKLLFNEIKAISSVDKVGGTVGRARRVGRGSRRNNG